MEVGTIKSLRSFKEELTEAIKKIVVLFLAIIMLVFFLPVGIVPEPDFTSDDGELIRITPSSELYSDNRNEDIHKIGIGHTAYHTFNLEGISETDIDDINSIRLRLSFITGTANTNGEIEISVLEPEYKPAKAVIGKHNTFFEKKYTSIFPQTSSADDSLCDIDLTELIKQRLDNGLYEITFKISGSAQCQTIMADSSYDDPMYRPCIKVATGVKTDTESQNLKRAALRDAVYVSQSEADRKGNEFTTDNLLKSGSGNEIYLRFDINEESILGSVNRAILSLDKSGINDSLVKIYCINNDEWSSDDISYNNRPRGNESTAFTSLSAPIDNAGRISFDVTQAVCEARSFGIRSLTFRIVCDREITFMGKGNTKSEPKLYLSASDNKNIVCVSEAALKTLGTNKPSFVTMKLSEEYISADGTEAKIRWTEYDINGNKPIRKRISSNGNITRPKWFEGDDEILAVAEIRSGKYSSQRQFSLVIPAEAAPDYSRYKFDNYINIGDSESEEKQKLEHIDVSGIRRRWTDGRMFSYRVPEKGGITVLNFSCLPDTENYLTLKLWEGDSSYYSDFSVEVCDTKSSEKLMLSAPTRTSDSDGGFVYATYALPRSFTDGKTHISLKLTYAENEKQELSARGIYSAYLTQSAYFDPKQFAKQGEKSISEPFFGEKAIEKFIDNLKSLAIPTGIEDTANNIPTAERTSQIINISPEKGSVVFAGNEINIAFSINETTKTAVIYQRMEYYDRYCSGCSVDEKDGVLVVDYGDYKLIWNKSTEGKPIPYDIMELSGVYKETISQAYCTFSEDWQMTDDSVIPDGAEVLNGSEMSVKPNSALLLVHISNPLSDSDWRVSHINNKNISEITFGANEKIEDVKIKSMGNILEDVNDVTVILGVYKDEKLSAIQKNTIPVIGSINTYTVDFSEYSIYMKKGQTLRIFVYDDTESSTHLSPKLELP